MAFLTCGCAPRQFTPFHPSFQLAAGFEIMCLTTFSPLECPLRLPNSLIQGLKKFFVQNFILFLHTYFSIMKVFLSWSEERSEAIANEFHEWIQCVNQKIAPFFSRKDLSGGIVWINELNTQLADTNAGIIFLTPENQDKPWIQFEAGALAKGFSGNRVFVLLLDMENHQVNKGPLSSFNFSTADEDGIRKLVYDLNNLLGDDKVNQSILSKVLDKYLPDLLERISIVCAKKPQKTAIPERSSDDVQFEILDILRSLSTRISNVEHSIIRNKGLTFTNAIPPAPEQLPEIDLTSLVRKNVARILLEKKAGSDSEKPLS